MAFKKYRNNKEETLIMRTGEFLHWLFCRNAEPKTQPAQKAPAQPPLTAYATIPNTGSELGLLMALAATEKLAASAPETGNGETSPDNGNHSGSSSPGCDL